MTSIVLPSRIEKRLKEESERTGASEEELVLEALSKILKEPLDPETKVEIHLKLSEKYMKDAEDFLSKKDYVQASEKAWGAASQIVKALAAKKGRELKSHRELHEFVANIDLGDRELGRLWRSAVSLHQNFYENWFVESQVIDGVEDVKRFLQKLKQ